MEACFEWKRFMHKPFSVILEFFFNRCSENCTLPTDIPHVNFVMWQLPHHHDRLLRILNSVIFLKFSDFNEAPTNSLMMIY